MRLFDRFISRSLPLIPRFIVRRVADPYIAGETLDDALATGRELNALGAAATFDLLGEEIKEEEKAREIGRRYCEILRAVDSAGLHAGVSVKPTALGLRVDPELTFELIKEILTVARESGRFVRIDMEDATTTDDTLRIYRRLREDGFDRVGVVLQSCLRRTLADARELAEMQADIRIVKGIYIESEEVAFQDPQVFRDNYIRILEVLLKAGCPVGVATHDDSLLSRMEAVIEELGIDRDALEIQMLLGVRERLRDKYIGLGYRMRVYVPFGELWHAYSVRRLRENPAIAGHVTRQLIGRILHRR